MTQNTASNGCSPPSPSPWMRGVDKASDIALSVSMYVLYPAILIVILIDVIGRNFFATPLSWAIEGSGLFLIGAIFLAASRVELDRSHILLDILYANYPQKIKSLCDMLTRAVACLWMLAATVRSSVEIHTAFVLQESGTDFRYPFWPMRMIMTLGFLLLTLALLSNVVSSYRQFRTGGAR
ncbi:MAG: TRAP transporter small permease [Desulfovibrionaceae bacterium]|nr:TRAP transporter small permease [Desulfovibrionaceae bacterium]